MKSLYIGCSGLLSTISNFDIKDLMKMDRIYNDKVYKTMNQHKPKPEHKDNPKGGVWCIS